MRIDSVTRFLQLRNSVTREKAALEKRLAYINHALSETSAGSRAAGPQAGPERKTRRGRRRMASNALSLEEAIRQSTATRPLTKKEIYDAVLKLGYKFTTTNPMNSINAKLYSKGLFKNKNGKFSPAR